MRYMHNSLSGSSLVVALVALVLSLASAGVAQAGKMKKDKMMDDDMSMGSMMRFNAPSLSSLYVVGSVGYAKYNLEDTDVQRNLTVPSVPTGQPAVPGFRGLKADDDDFAFRVGAGWRINRIFAFEVAYSDLGSPVVVERIESVIQRDVDIDYTEIVEFGLLTNIVVPGTDRVAPFVRVGGFSFDGDKHDDIQINYGVGLEFYNVRAELIRYEFEPEPVDTFFLSYALPLDFLKR